MRAAASGGPETCSGLGPPGQRCRRASCAPFSDCKAVLSARPAPSLQGHLVRPLRGRTRDAWCPGGDERGFFRGMSCSGGVGAVMERFSFRKTQDVGQLRPSAGYPYHHPPPPQLTDDSPHQLGEGGRGAGSLAARMGVRASPGAPAAAPRDRTGGRSLGRAVRPELGVSGAPGV